MCSCSIKHIGLSFWDWRRQWLQFITLIIVFFLPLIFDADKLLNFVFLEDGIKLDNYIYYLILKMGKFGICLVSAIVYDVAIIRQWNEDYILNRGGIYHEHSYLGYCFCSGVLGYKKCNLRLVPIPLQFKLVINGVFAEYVYDEGIHGVFDGEQEAKVHRENNSNYTQKINLILIDTYTIQKGQLPAEVLNLTSIYITRHRKRNDNVRYASEKFVNKVLNIVRQLPEFVTEVNIFATLNPTNCYNIAKEVFNTGGRDHIRHLWVYQQDKEVPRHFTKKVKIF